MTTRLDIMSALKFSHGGKLPCYGSQQASPPVGSVLCRTRQRRAEPSAIRHRCHGWARCLKGTALGTLNSSTRRTENHASQEGAREIETVTGEDFTPESLTFESLSRESLAGEDQSEKFAPESRARKSAASVALRNPDTDRRGRPGEAHPAWSRP